MSIEPRTLKGFRDFLPKEARKRQFVIETLKRVFESYGFEPLETPALEYEDILLGKYGEEGDKLMYRFEDNGKRRVALRYDQTVPLARVVAQYQNDLPLPFKRYQIQNVWRADNTQKGRFREFLQCDIDTVGTDSILSDAEIIEMIYESFRILGLNVIIKINDRSLLSTISIKALTILDKLAKIGEEEVAKELEAAGESKDLINQAKSFQTSQRLDEIKVTAVKLGVPENVMEFDPTMVRGLNYYTGLILEVVVEGYSGGSVGGGGRYDNLIGMFSNQTVPAVGFAFGFDRVLEAMEELNLFPQNLQKTKVLVVASNDLLEKSIQVCGALEKAGINQELYVDPNAKFEKQFKYAEKKEIPYVVVPIDNQTVELRTKSEAGEIIKKTVTINELPNELR